MDDNMQMFVVQDPRTNLYYRGSGRWVVDVDKAKYYSKKGHAKLAITTYREGRASRKGLKFYILAFAVTPAEAAWEY